MHISTILKKTFFFFLSLSAFTNVNAQSQGGLIIESRESCNDKIVEIEIRTDDWNDVIVTQFALNWDPEVLSYVDQSLPNSTFQDMEFGDTKVDLGQLAVAWYDGATVGISPNDELFFKLKFNVIGESNTFSPIVFSDSFTTEFYYNLNGQITDYTAEAALTEGEITVLADPRVEFETVVNPTPGSADGSIAVTVTDGIGPYDVLWNNGESGMELTNLQTGAYRCTVTDANNCASVNGPYNVGIVSTDDLDGLTAFDLSPNPAREIVNLNVAFAKSEITNIRILDVTGKTLYQNQQTGAAFSLGIPVNDFNNGTYFVEIATENGTAVERLVVVK